MKKRYFNTIISKIPENNRFELIWKLAQVDFKKRYYNDRLGIFWALLNPIIRVMVYFLAFSYLIPRAIEGIDNFALFLFSALIFWLEFTQIIRKSMRLLLQKRYLIENIKIFIIDLFVSLALASFIGFIFNLFAYVCISLLFGTEFGSQLIFLPILTISLYLIAIGVGMLLSSIYIFFSDINHLVDIIILLGFWTSGIFFPADKILEVWPPLYYINPFVGLLDNVRNILVYNLPLDFQIMTINLTQAIFIYLIGYKFMEKYSPRAFEYL